MTTIGIIGAGEIGSQVARAAVATGYDVVIAKIAKAFTHIQAPRITTTGRPLGTPGRPALSVSSDFPEAVELVTRLYGRSGFDAVDNSPLRESWRSGPGQPAWLAHEHQTRGELETNLAEARPIIVRQRPA